MTNKEKYSKFIKSTYVPIFSKPWWLDVVCGEYNWDVWIYEKGDEFWAAMPYYIEYRNNYKFITKPKLTQNNGLIIKYPNEQKISTKQEYEEKVINSVMDFIDNFDLDVYEQQYHYYLENWLPFFWRNCTSTVRYTYVIENTENIDNVFNNFSPNCRKNIRKGERTSKLFFDLPYDKFYYEHEKIFKKQSLVCPFTFELWEKLYFESQANNCGKIIYSKDDIGNITSLMFVVWDEKSLYPLLGGVIPEYSNTQSYSFLTYESIKIASEKKLMYDFEGSVIKRINHSFRDFGGTPKRYYRIRKIYNEDILIKEAKEYMDRIKKEKIIIG
jgi:hypothetical protein